jgi:hypothetical protein
MFSSALWSSLDVRLCVCADNTQHLNELNITLQERNHLVNEMFYKITAFEKNLRLWKLHLRRNNATLINYDNTDDKKYAEEIQLVQQEFNFLYASMRPQSTYFQCHLTLTLKLSAQFQMEIMDLQFDTDPRNVYPHVRPLCFHEVILFAD